MSSTSILSTGYYPKTTISSLIPSHNLCSSIPFKTSLLSLSSRAIPHHPPAIFSHRSKPNIRTQATAEAVDADADTDAPAEDSDPTSPPQSDPPQDPIMGVENVIVPVLKPTTKAVGRPRLVLKFIWMEKNIGLGLDQLIPGHGTVPLSPYFFWPRKDAWEELKAVLESKPSISQKKMIILLNQATDIINLWQQSGGNLS